MARKYGDRRKSARPRGPNSESQALKTRSMDEIMGLEPLNLNFHEEILTPKSSLQDLKQQSELRHTFNDWLESIHRSN